MRQDMAKRMQLLEEKFEYQDQLLETLNQVIIRQQATIDSLQLEIETLKAAVASGAMEDVNERPPHY